MKTFKKFTFIFNKPVACYGELIKEDVVFAVNLKNAVRILKREYHFADIYKVLEAEVTLYDKHYKYNALPSSEIPHLEVSRIIAELAESKGIL